jgi:hypothetical protein
MNLTLSVDKKILEKARVTAGAMGLSLNEMVRRYLEQVAGEGDQAGTFQELRDLCTTRGGHSAGRTWTREDLHRG